MTSFLKILFAFYAIGSRCQYNVRTKVLVQLGRDRRCRRIILARVTVVEMNITILRAETLLFDCNNLPFVASLFHEIQPVARNCGRRTNF
jgi:hypothetical protein